MTEVWNIYNLRIEDEFDINESESEMPLPLKTIISVKDIGNRFDIHDIYNMYNNYNHNIHIDFNGVFGIPLLSLKSYHNHRKHSNILTNPVEHILLKTFIVECNDIVNVNCIFDANYYLSFCDYTDRYDVIISDVFCGVIDTHTCTYHIFYKGVPIVYKNNNSFTFELSKNDIKIGFIINNNTLTGSISHKNKKQDIIVTATEDSLMKFFRFENKDVNRLVFSHTLSTPDKTIETVNKDGMMIQSTYFNDTNRLYTISKCMLNDESGIRYRGTYTDEKQGDKSIKKTLQKDDTIIYNKEKDTVTVDTLKPVRTGNEITIGWKVAKTITGEQRIIKIGIPSDATIVRPIDIDFFHSSSKQRCDKAIVMDIQLPEMEEISVVPDEMVAYSYIHETNLAYSEASTASTAFSYRVGSIVTPDSFNPDENTSCTNGIHFLPNRSDLFKMYIK